MTSFFKVVILLHILFNPVLVVSAQTQQQTTTPTGQTQQTQTQLNLPKYSESGVDKTIKDYLCTPSEPADGKDLERCVNRLYRFGVAAGAFILVFMLVLAGYMYITGGETGAGKAKGMIANALTGMGILLFSYVLLYFINPSLVAFKPIQPPIFSAENLPQCKELGFGENCNVATGEKSGSDSVVGSAACRGGLTCGGSIYNNFPHYNQAASPWGSMSYQCNTTVATSGCGPSSMAQVLTYYKNKNALKIDPKVQAKYGADTTPSSIAPLALSLGLRVCNQGSAHALPAVIGKLYGLQVQSDVTWAQAEAALRKNIPVIATMKANTPFTNGGHFITLVAIVGDTVYFADTGPRNVTSGPISVTKSSASSLHIVGN